MFLLAIALLIIVAIVILAMCVAAGSADERLGLK